MYSIDTWYQYLTMFYRHLDMTRYCQSVDAVFLSFIDASQIICKWYNTNADALIKLILWILIVWNENKPQQQLISVICAITSYDWYTLIFERFLGGGNVHFILYRSSHIRCLSSGKSFFETLTCSLRMLLSCGKN